MSPLTDVRQASTALLRAPAFLAPAVLTLALAIGANTAVFTVVNAVLVRPLPYAAPDRIVGVWSSWDGRDRGLVSPGEYADYRRDARAFEAFGIYGSDAVTLQGANAEPERVAAGFVTSGVLTALGVTPVLGDVFTPDDDRPGGDPRVILGEDLWRRRFGASPAVLGSRITIDGRASLVIGVLPRTFLLPHEFDSAEHTALYLPLALPPEQATVRGNHSFRAVARLRAGFTVDQASADVARVARGFTAALPGEYPPSQRFSAHAVAVTEDVNGAMRRPLLFVLGAVACLLLVACTNVATLFMVRADAMRAGMAIRTALGASGFRLASYVVSEVVLLCTVAGVCGVAVATVLVRGLRALAITAMPRLAEASLDGTALGYAAAMTGLAAVAVGTLPLVRIARLGTGALPSNGARTTTGRVRTRQGLLTVQVGLTVVLVLGATLLASSFVRLLAIDPGYSTEGILAADLSLPESTYPDAASTTAFYARLLAALEEQAGVTAAGAVANLPLASGDGDLNIAIVGRETPAGSPSRRANWQVVTPGYFEAMRMRMIRGRTISAGDTSTGAGVVVISESMAREYWPGIDPVGARFRLGGGAGPGVVTVIGVVQDVKHNSLAEGPARQMYLAHSQFTFWGGGMEPARRMTIVLRTEGPPAAFSGVIARAVRSLDPGLPLGTTRTMAEVRGDSLSQSRFLVWLVAAFSVAALAVALIGISGAVSYAVNERRREIGIRMAVGATPRGVTAQVVRQGMVPSILGIVCGTAVGVLVSGSLRSLLFGISPRDPAIVGGVAAAAACVAWLASYLPARRAAHVDPAMVLKPE